MATDSALVKTEKTNGASFGNQKSNATMKALVYHGPGKKTWEEIRKPVVLQLTDAVVKILNTTICGTDLHSGWSR